MMKIITLFFCILCFKSISQPLNPSIEFGGTIIDWKYKLIDTFNKPIYTAGIITEEDFGFMDSPPLEANGRIYLNYNNAYSPAFGNKLHCYDLTTGEIVWVKYYNPSTQDGYGFNYYNHLNYLGNNQLELNGISSHKNNLPNGSGASYYLGRYSKRIIDINTGEDLFVYSKNGYSFYSSIFSDRYHRHLNSNQETFYIINRWRNKDYSLIPMYLDIENDTIIDSRIVDTIDLVYFSPYNSNGSTNPLSVKGPFVNQDSTLFTYYTEHLVNQVWKHFFWQTDAIGNVIFKNDVSEDLNGENDNNFVSSIAQSENKIIAITRSPDATHQDHLGYAVFDLDGNILKNKSQLTIEGNKVGHMSSIFTNNNELLHVIRFQKNNNVFLYKEDALGNYTKTGELINPNEKDIAFIPRYLIKTSDNGIVLTGEFLLESKKFLQGGWQVIMKISGEALGLPTSTENISSLPSFTISPNPTSSYIKIKTEIEYDEVFLYDLKGVIVLKSDGQYQIDLSNLANGTYLCELRRNGKAVSRGVKVLKAE